MKKVSLAALSGIVAGLLLSSEFIQPLTAQELQQNAQQYEHLNLFGDIYARIEKQYVEEPERKKLIEAAINGMLTSLDPHSSYLNAEEFDDMQVQTRGEFGGLGIEVTQEGGVIKVIAPIDDTPAARAGIEAGDFITAVDGEPLSGLTMSQSVKKMRGPAGSDTVITIVRDGVPDPFDVTITRDIIKLTPVRSRTVGNTVVLRITTFNDQTYPKLEEALNKEVEKLGGIESVDGFILDLRNNPGGLLTQAISVSDAFLDKGEIVSTRGREKGDVSKSDAIKGDLAQGKPIVVLVNGGSASASEIVTGALQDHHRAIVIGTKTFGKGSVQTIVPLPSGGAMRLTTSRYYTPSGRSIQALGIMPDIIVEQPKKTTESAEDLTPEKGAGATVSEADLRGRLNNDSVSDAEKLVLEEELKVAREASDLRSEDYQLAYAVDIIRGLAKVEKAE